jgi:hypothetical protein
MNQNEPENLEPEMPDFASMANEDEEPNDYLSPEEVENLRKKNEKGIITSLTSSEEDDLETEVSLDEAIHLVEATENNNAYGGRLKVEFETMGRFNLPDTMFFDNYKTTDLQELGLARDEDMVATLVKVLDKRIVGNTNVSMNDALMEEFYEVLINIKAQYDTVDHVFHYMCDCQNEKPDNQRKVSTYKIKLNDLKYRSITEAEEYLRKQMKVYFDDMSEEEFLSVYVKKRYGKIIKTSKEEELLKIKIKEPIMFKSLVKPDEVLQLRFTRVKDLIFGMQVATRMFSPKIRKIRNTYKANMKEEELNEWKRNELDKIESEKIKKAIEYTKSQALLSLNGKEFPSQQDKINYYLNMDMIDTKALSSYFDAISFGLHDEREMTCEHCGKTKKRELHRELSPMEFLPSQDDKRDSSASTISRHSIGNFYFPN